MIKTNEILRQYILNLFTPSAEITKNGDKHIHRNGIYGAYN